MANLTKDADKMVCTLYKVFLNHRKEGQSREEARCFEDLFFIQEKPFSTMNRQDVSDLQLELARANYIKRNIMGDCKLTDIAIIDLENRFKNGVADVLSFLSQFIP